MLVTQNAQKLTNEELRKNIDEYTEYIQRYNKALAMKDYKRAEQNIKNAFVVCTCEEAYPELCRKLKYVQEAQCSAIGLLLRVFFPKRNSLISEFD